MRKSTIILIIILVIAILVGGMYWFYSKNIATPEDSNITQTQNGFSPFGRNEVKTPVTSNTISTQSTSTPVTQNVGPIQLPKLRQLSVTPVAGMFASTTKMKSLTLASTTINTTILRFIDRGMGHVYQTNDVNLAIDKISNTTLPKIYEAYWNKNLTAVILRYLRDNSDDVSSFYAELRPVATSTASSTTPFEIKGRYLSSTINQIAVSPSGDRIFTWNIEGGRGVGYISSFDEKGKVKVVDVPFTQAQIAWPETNTLAINTNASGLSSSFLYIVNVKTGEMKRVIGNIRGLSSKISGDVKSILYSYTNKLIGTRLYDINSGSTTDVIFKTLADKCVWSTLRKNEVYCAVPTETPEGIYPDDWYKGKVSFVDKIWHLDTRTGEVHLLGDLLNLSDKLIDATQLTLDPKENFLYFINKRDLSLWSLDLNQ
jgi:hypothetical protein